MSAFEDTIKVQRAKTEEKKHRDAHEKQAKKVMDELTKYEEKKLMEMETLR